MASEELNKMKTILGSLDSQATTNPQPSKNFNSGSNKIDGANPTSPSTNNATRREQYNNYIKTLDKEGLTSLYNTVKNYREMGLTDSQIYDNVLGKANQTTVTTTSSTTPKTTQGLDLSIKGNFDVYNPIDWKSQPELMQQYYIQANNDIKSARRALSQYMLQQEALESKSSNINDVTTLIDAIENAYDKGVFDTNTIANTLGVSPEVVSLVQQGKANELVKLDQEFVQDKLKSYFRAEEDYDTNLQRTMEDYELAKTNLDRQYNSAMQTLRRNLFDEKRTASVGSAVAGISGSEYAVKVIEAKHQQNMDDLEGNYLYSSISQKYSYTRAIEDYNRNIQRLSEDFDDALKDIQASVLQQFQEIDSKIGLTTAQLAQAYGTLEQNVASAKANALTNYITALSNGEDALANAIADTFGIDSSIATAGLSTSQVDTAFNNFMTTYKDIIASGGAIRKGWCGEPVNEYLKFLGSGLQITQAKDLAPYATSKYPTKGAIAYFDGTQSRATANTKKYGHTGIVVSVDPNKGTVTVLDSNGKNKMGLGYSTYKLSDVTGYYDPRQGTIGGGDQATSGRYQQGDTGLYEKYLQGKDLQQIQKTVQADSTYGKTADERWKNFKDAAKQYQAEAAAEPIAGFQDKLDTLVEFTKAWGELSDNDRDALAAADVIDNGLISYVGLPESALRVARLYNQIKGQAFINGIITSKQQGASYGQLSDNEGRKIEQAATALSLQTPSYVMQDINYMMGGLQSFITALGGTPDSTSGYDRYNSSPKGIRRPGYTPSQYIEALIGLYGDSNLNINSSVTGNGFNATQGNRSFGGGTTGTGTGTHQTTMK